MNRRWLVVLGALPLALLGILAGPAQPAAAHPLGNFSVNQYEGLTLRPDRIDVAAVVDVAEIPTLQNRSIVDANPTGYAATACRELSTAFEVRVTADRLLWTVEAPSFGYRPGAGGLSTSRLTCTLHAAANLTGSTSVTIDNHYRTDRVGWREITAVGTGIRLVNSPLPERSVSDELRSYPADLLSSALDQRGATLRVEPGTDTAAASVAAPHGGDLLSRWSAAAERRFQSIAGGRLTPLVGVLAVLLAVLLGAGHAALPGHGKTVLAAYLAGRRGRPRDALAVGATVTLTHTGGVLVVGLLLSTSTALAGDRLLSYLGLASGILVATVGVGMVVGTLRRRPGDSHTHHGHTHHGHTHHGHTHHGHTHHGHTHHSHTHHEDGDHRHGQTDHDHARHEDHPHENHEHGDHPHGDHEHEGHEHEGHEHEGHEHEGHPQEGHKRSGGEGGNRRPGGRLGLAGIGLAGGLVPSPSALVVLLGAIGLGRAGFGVVLVIAYGVGMAGTLTAAGLLLLAVQRRMARAAGRSRFAARWVPLAARLRGAGSTATAALVVLVGLGLTIRALAGAV